MTLPALTDLGPDTVELVKRAPVLDDAGNPVLDQWGRPQRVERTLTRERCAVQIVDGTEDIDGTVIAVLRLRAMLPVDDDTEGLVPADAVRYKGRLYELVMPGVRHEFLSGDPSHVRVAGTWAADVSLGEQVIVIPAGARRDDGYYEPDGQPVPLIAKAVVPLSASRGKGIDVNPAADYTVILDVDAPISDGDWIIVRGQNCVATLSREESQWAGRRALSVFAQYRAGGSS